MELPIRESQERYRLLFQEAPCYISIQDRDLRIVEANRRFREDFGDQVGRKCFEVYKHRDKACAPCPVQQTFHDGQTHHSEEVVLSRDGEPINVLVYAAALRDAEGRIQSVMEMSANITEIRQLQSQLESIGLLVGAISHSIKGLLTGLDGGRYLLSTGLKKKDESRVERGWSMVQRNVDQIRGLVLNILFYARDHEPEWKIVCAPRLLREVTGLFEGKAQENHIELIKDIESDAGEFEGDPQAMRSLLVNLLENSWDACSADEAKPQHQVRARVRGFPEHVEFEIEDDGPGMDQETREKAFTLFFTSKGAKGTGLGLFISNKIAQAHGGSIRLESEVDKGARFLVTIPRKRP
ncbi:MAG: PAS domain-containing sensor histidine kinase [Candidatus Sumerlaeota bacterium]|nr:PAS domain-containing sensor histidine kinase [Candidatus Sumerlaeota bacterium]